MIYNDARPTKFDEMKGQTLVVENIRNQSKRDSFFPVFILCGQYGSGKTTMARLIAMAANCEHKDKDGNPCGECESCRAVLDHEPEGIIEIDGASNNGVENIRQLLAKAMTLGMYRKKVIVIDEAHMLSKSAFNALLITLENPPKHCIFILCTTEKDALPETVVSRAPVYTFGKISDEVIKNHILEVAEKNCIRISSDAAGLLSRYANGAMRNALQLLEHMSLQKGQGEEISDQDVIAILGLSSIEERFHFLDACMSGSIQGVVSVLEECEGKGISLKSFLTDVLSMATDLLLYRAGSAVTGSSYYMECMGKLALYGDGEAGKLCRVLNQLCGSIDRSLSRERIVISVLSTFRKERAFEETVAKRIPVAAAQERKEVPGHAEEIPENPAKLEEKGIEESEAGSRESGFVHDSGENPFAEPDEPETEESVEPDDMMGFGFDNMFGGLLGASGFESAVPKSKKRPLSPSYGESSLLMAAGSPSDEGAETEESESEDLEPVAAVSEECGEADLPETVVPSEEEGRGAALDQEPDLKIDEGELSWEAMAKAGLVPDRVELPAMVDDDDDSKDMSDEDTGDDPDEEPDEEPGDDPDDDEWMYGNVGGNAGSGEEEDEELSFRTRADLLAARDELKKLLKNVGFKILYEKARYVEKDYQIYLVYNRYQYCVAATAYTAFKKGIKAVMESDL